MARRKGVCNQFAATGTCSYGTSCKFSHKPSSSSSSSGFNSNALNNFFEDRGGFIYNPSNSAWDEFDRLARYLRWGKEEKADERDRFKDALVKMFNSMYGTDENSLELWMSLCRVLGISTPDGLDACREAVKATHVNLVDLVDNPHSLQLFDTEAELSAYTLENHKVFPRENVHAGGLLRHLLRHIMSPGAEGSRSLRSR